MTPRKTKQEVSYDEIKKELADIKHMLAERKHLDDEVLNIKHELEGNGKPGFKATRDKVQSWETKVNAIMLVLVGDIIFRVVQLAMIQP